MFFWNSLAASIIQQMLAIWSLVPLPLWNSACTSGSSQFTYCWNQTLLMGSMCMMDSYLEHSSLLPLCLNLHLLFAQTQDQRDEKNESLLRSLLGITQSCICVSLDISSRIYQGFSLSSLPSWRSSLVPLCFMPLEWYHLHIWGCWYLSWQSWFQLVSHPA